MVRKEGCKIITMKQHLTYMRRISAFWAVLSFYRVGQTELVKIFFEAAWKLVFFGNRPSKWKHFCFQWLFVLTLLFLFLLSRSIMTSGPVLLRMCFNFALVFEMIRLLVLFVFIFSVMQEFVAVYQWRIDTEVINFFLYARVILKLFAKFVHFVDA